MYNFSFSTHNEQLLFVTFCDTTSGIEDSVQTHQQNNRRTHGWTDRREGWNSYLDDWSENGRKS